MNQRIIIVKLYKKNKNQFCWYNLKLFNMKKIIFILTLVITTNSFAQDFKGNISGTVGLINLKARIQYETPIGDNLSTGVNLNYYFVNWTGPLIEPFFRIYSKKEGNTEGWFLQGKLGYGNLWNHLKR